jgi:hypothetical protein
MVRTPLLFVLMFGLNLEAYGAIRCIIRPLHLYGDGAALCLSRRYEDDDCLPSQCTSPTNVWDYRTVGEWYPYPESCTTAGSCFTWGGPPLTADKARSERSQSAKSAEAHKSDDNTNSHGHMPVDEEFRPDEPEARTITDDATAHDKKFYRLKIKDKTAVSTDGESSARMPKDIRVKMFRVTYPDKDGVGTDSYWMAYETTQQDPTDGDKDVEKAKITKLRFEKQGDDFDGEKAIILCISGDPFDGDDVYLLRKEE